MLSVSIVSPPFYGYRSQLKIEEFKYLVHFVHAYGGLALLQFTDKAQTNARLVGEVLLREIIFLTQLFDSSG